MSGTFRPRLEILSLAQQRLWPALKSAAELGFVLYGGTAIALRLGAQSTVVQDERNTLSVLVPCGDSEHTHVKVSFFGAIGFGRVGEPDLTDDGVLQVASLNDLMATKVKVVLQRAEAKDYRDIAEMVKAGVSLAGGLAAARAIFGTTFQPSESLKALVYFDDGDLHTLTRNEKNTLVQAVSAVRALPNVAILSKQLIVMKSR